LWECFLLGSNSTCCGHIAGHHFEEYKKWCNEATPKIKPNFCCIPEAVVNARKEKGKVKLQTMLNFPRAKVPMDFMREGLQEAVAKHIACDDEVRRP
jgi:hypothetical protein